MYRATQKIHRATEKLGRVRAVPRLCGHYPGICLTTEEKARKNLSQGSPNVTAYISTLCFALPRMPKSSVICTTKLNSAALGYPPVV
jgi:hypothetical protein